MKTRAKPFSPAGPSSTTTIDGVMPTSSLKTSPSRPFWQLLLQDVPDNGPPRHPHHELSQNDGPRKRARLSRTRSTNDLSSEAATVSRDRSKFGSETRPPQKKLPEIEHALAHTARRPGRSTGGDDKANGDSDDDEDDSEPPSSVRKAKRYLSNRPRKNSPKPKAVVLNVELKDLDLKRIPKTAEKYSRTQVAEACRRDNFPGNGRMPPFVTTPEISLRGNVRAWASGLMQQEADRIGHQLVTKLRWEGHYELSVACQDRFDKAVEYILTERVRPCMRTSISFLLDECHRYDDRPFGIDQDMDDLTAGNRQLEEAKADLRQQMLALQRQSNRWRQELHEEQEKISKWKLQADDQTSQRVIASRSGSTTSLVHPLLAKLLESQQSEIQGNKATLDTSQSRAIENEPTCYIRPAPPGTLENLIQHVGSMKSPL